MRYREVKDADCRRVQDCILDMNEVETLDEAAAILTCAAMDLVACDHGSYTEVDIFFDRTRLLSSVTELQEWAERRAGTWQELMPTHPVLRYRNENPNVPVVRLSDVTNLPEFYKSALYNELFREFETDYQLVMNLGFSPDQYKSDLRFPITAGVPLNRKKTDFSRRDMQTLSLLQQMARPILRRKRSKHFTKLMDAAELTPELTRVLMGFGLTQPQCEVTFWMLKGKSNSDIGSILEIGSQTVRQRSMSIYRKLDVSGRLAMQREILRATANLT